MKKTILVVGLGRFGMSIVKKLSQYNCEVMAIDSDIQLVEDASQYATEAIRIDAGDVDTLKRLPLNNVDVAIVSMASDVDTNIMSSMVLKDQGVPYVISKAKNDIHKKILSKIGVDKIILPEEEMGIRIAKSIMNTNIIETIEFSEEYSIIEVIANKEWIDKKIGDLDLRDNFGVNILCVKNSTEGLIISPNSSYVIKENDILMVIAENNKIDKNNIEILNF